MKNKIPKLIMFTCDESVWVTYFTTRLWTKYLKDLKILVLGYNNLVNNYESNVKFVSLGKKRNLKTWFNDISNYLKKLNDDIIIYSPDDYCLKSSVNEKFLDFALDYIRKFKVANIYCSSKQMKKNAVKLVDKNHKFEIYECPYHPNISNCSIWNKKCLTNLLGADFTNFDKYPIKEWMLNKKIASSYYFAHYEYYAKKIINSFEKYKEYKFIFMNKYNKLEVLDTIKSPGLLSRMKYSDNVCLDDINKKDINFFYDIKHSNYLKANIIFGKDKNGNFILKH